ncbi:MAG: amidohydrolase family protein [Candidatus Paceibacterota bacterium]|jgi:N-acyl-D-amino-acid deacylase
MTTLIKNVQLIDGTGRASAKADVLIKNDKIFAMGSFPSYKAAHIIDGMGAYLAPGFIDINNDSDRYLTIFSNPSQKDLLLQGVTTIIGGQCGSSLAPLIYGSLGAIKHWTDIDAVNISWRTVGEFLKVLSRRQLGVNFGTLVGHGTIKRDLIGDDFRDLTKNEINVFKSILEKSLKEGAFGFSTGLGYGQGIETPYEEIKALLSIVSKHKAFYASHLRDEKKGLLSSINETLNLAKESRVKTLISHFRPIMGYKKDYEQSLELISQSLHIVDVYFDLYPFSTSTVSIHSFLPNWVLRGGEEVIKENLKNPDIREKIIKELPRLKGEEILISHAPKHPYLVGKTLKEFSDNRNSEVREGLLALMELTNFQAVVFYKNISIVGVKEALKHSQAVIASNSAAFADSFKVLKPDRATQTFPKFLEMAEKSLPAGRQGLMPVEEAVKKITSLPAKILGLKGRGVIRDGNFADLTIFKDGKIQTVIVNGKIAVNNSQFTNILAGKVLRREP